MPGCFTQIFTHKKNPFPQGNGNSLDCHKKGTAKVRAFLTLACTRANPTASKPHHRPLLQTIQRPHVGAMYTRTRLHSAYATVNMYKDAFAIGICDHRHVQGCACTTKSQK
eukprot:1160533-Pelagomonas_calceolata.AAC.2